MKSDEFLEGFQEKRLIIHTPCGLPIELCECPNAELKYNWDTDTFHIRKPLDLGKFRFSKKEE